MRCSWLSRTNSFLVLYTKRFVSSVPLLRMNLTLLPFMVIVQDPILRAFAEHRYYLLALRTVLVSILFTVLTMSLERIGLLGASHWWSRSVS